MADKKVLNLDELFGRAEPIQVELQDKLYTLKRPEAFGPLDYQHLIEAYALFNDLQALAETGSGKAITERDDAKLREAVTAILRLIAPDLLRSLKRMDLPFGYCMVILQHYSDRWKESLPPSEAEKGGPLTGETSTPASPSGAS
jgi:hypothetical protein